MFPPQVQLVFNAQTAIHAGQTGDPKFHELVDKLMERLQLTKEQVMHNTILLANGKIF